MYRMFMLALALLSSTALLQAQDPSAQSSKPTSAQAGSASGQTTVEGCLQGSNGSFTLTDNAGTTYQLQGDTAKLSKHAGHQVQITGSTSGSSASSAGSSSSAGGSQMLTVEKVKHISESCKTAGK
jgi:uncharacterized protein DUF5818